MSKVKRLCIYFCTTLLLLVMFTSPTNANSASLVYYNDFDGGLIVAPGVTDTLSGITTTESVQGYEGIGTGNNTFADNFLRNTTGGYAGSGSIGTPGSPTTLTLTGLPPHISIDINFLLAIVDSWDGNGQVYGPDILTVTVDGNTVFSESFGFNDPTFDPPPGVQLTGHVPLGFNPDFDDVAYDMGLDPTFNSIPHTASTLTIEWVASGAGWQGDNDESWAIDNLEVVLEALPPLVVDIDIKPQSCSNPLNMKERGVVSVAILPTDDFDVSMIDPASVLLEGVSPLRWSWEDVATPYEPWTGKEGEYDCNEYGPDGYVDLTLKFKAQEILVALGSVSDGDVLVLQLVGNLKDEFGGTEFFGEDVVKIIKKIATPKCSELVVLQSFASPAGSNPHGLAFDGENLWSVGYDTNTIYKLNLEGDILSSFASPGQGPTGLTFDGTYLWNADDGSLQISKLDISGNVITSFDAPGTDSTGLTFEGKYLWNADFNWGIPGGYLHRIDVSNPEDISFTSFASPGEGPEGLAFDGKYLWHVDIYENVIYKLDTYANVICTYQSFGTNPIGLTFDGTYLWLADQGTSNIYKIDIGYK